MKRNKVLLIISLFIGINAIIGSIMLIKNKKISYDLEIIFGILLMLWIIIQFIILPFNLLSLTFFILGLIQTILAYICKVRYIQSVFKINYEEYKNIK